MSLSTATHRFQRGQAPRDGACLFWSFLMATARYFKEIFGIFPLDRQIWLALIDHLRVTVTDYILGHSEMHCEVLASQTEFKNVKDYCAAIVSGKLWGGDPELKVLSILYNIIICVIDPTIINLYNHLVPSFYGQDNPLAKRCIYIYFNGKDHFDPLILKNKNTNSFCGIFRRYDLKVTCILWEYIKQLKRMQFTYCLKCLFICFFSFLGAIICEKKNETRDIEKKGALSSSIASTKRKTTGKEKKQIFIFICFIDVLNRN